MLLSIVINYIGGRCIALAGRARKTALAASLLLDLLLLGIFKYAGFLCHLCDGGGKASAGGGAGTAFTFGLWQLSAYQQWF